MSSDFSVKFYGCRGSFPVAGAQYQRYGGATPCVVVRAGQREIVLDSGSGIVAYGKDVIGRAMREKTSIDTFVFLTHMHLDHLIGLPFYGPMYIEDTTMHVWGPRMGKFDSLEACVNELISPPFFPVPLHEMNSHKTFYDITEADSVYFLKDKVEPVHCRRRQRAAHGVEDDAVEVEVQCMRGYNHPKSGVMIYKVMYQGKSVVYATDTEGYVHGDQRLTKFAKGATALIHDAMYTSDRYISMPSPTQGYGHSTVDIAANVAKQAGVEQLFLFHHDPGSTDDALDRVDALGKSLFEHTRAAYDGLDVEL